MRRVLPLALMWLVGFPGPAEASTLLYDSSGRWVHQHTRTYTYRFDTAVPSHVRTGTRAAAREWSDRTILTLTETTGVALISIVMRQVDPYIGFAWVPFHAAATVAFDPDWARYSLTRALTNGYQALPCHELGHALGLGHGGAGCMTSSPSSRSPGADDIALLDRQYVSTGH